MSLPRPSNPGELSTAIDKEWTELQAFLSGVTDEQGKRHDANGWTITDHVTHIAVWEDSVAVLFRGGRRHDALGIDEAFYKDASFDEINEAIKSRHQNVALSEALTLLTHVHAGLMLFARPMTNDQLQTTVSDFFRLAPRGDDRTMATFIFDNTAGHYLEHLQWMKDLIGRAA